MFGESVRQQYPAFFMEYQECQNDTQGEVLADLVDSAVAEGQRIDESRIYLTGFSAGGSGSYRLVRGFLSQGRLFAGIIRVAGQSETQLPDDAVAQTSIWYHIGLDDTPTRVQVAQDAYDFLKTHAYNATAVETTASDSVTVGSTEYPRTTQTLTQDGIEIVKYTQCPDVGHTPEPAYADPGLFDWLFGQSLDCR
jgi:predicted peptidase